MLTAKPIQNKEEQKSACKLCSIPFRPEAFAYSQKENNEIIAMSQFDILSDGGVILDLQMKDGLSDDIEALFILGRAVLNFLDLSGIKSCSFNLNNKSGVYLPLILSLALFKILKSDSNFSVSPA